MYTCALRHSGFIEFAYVLFRIKVCYITLLFMRLNFVITKPVLAT